MTTQQVGAWLLILLGALLVGWLLWEHGNRAGRRDMRGEYLPARRPRGRV